MTEDDAKGGIHAATATLLAIMAAYNLVRCCSTGARRNAVNALIYTPLVFYEWHQVRYHWTKQIK